MAVCREGNTSPGIMGKVCKVKLRKGGAALCNAAERLGTCASLPVLKDK